MVRERQGKELNHREDHIMKTRKTLKVQTATAKSILEFIETWAQEQTTDARSGEWPSSDLHSLWTILTALRGPDHTEDDPYEAEVVMLKDETTAIIRGVVLPTFTKKSGGILKTNKTKEDLENLASSSNPLSKSLHFGEHIRSAANVILKLGLMDD